VASFFAEKSSWMRPATFARFAGVFEGCFGKSGEFLWWICGQIVVNCVINVDKKGSFRRRKMRHDFQLFFRLNHARLGRRAAANGSA
jgi:hypothetical protein